MKCTNEILHVKQLSSIHTIWMATYHIRTLIIIILFSGTKGDVCSGVGQKLYQCRTCGKQFALESELECYRGIHEREKLCNACSRFSQSSNVILQKATLTEE